MVLNRNKLSEAEVCRPFAEEQPLWKRFLPKRWLVLCLLFGLLFLVLWHILSSGSPFPGPMETFDTAWYFLSDPFYNHGPNDLGIGTLTLMSLGRLMAGFLLGSFVAVFSGVFLGLNKTLFKALNPYLLILKAISPIAWLPLLLYSVEDSGLTGILVVFMASVWPTLANTAFSVATIRKDILYLADILQMSPVDKFIKIILPAAGPSIVSGLKISMGSAWVALVPAEALLGSLGLGYFVWNEWNNLSLPSVIFAILMIGLVGVIIDFLLSKLADRIAYDQG